uniref:SCP2 domain-containing protein n=1 Tax=Hyaloperonospora arabidopsidis (strain Emoy2) TaxID=559515 RepID=M4C148_HYAAE
MLSFGSGSSAHVAIVTGAGRGLGRAWAQALASRGVRVVVNDNDVDRSLVEAVVQSICSGGGVAVGDFHCVTDGATIVKTAMENFKRVDILINAVWSIMRQQKYGRILNCVSGAGLYGNFGQVNYAAMKMGLVGFTVALNQEGAKYNIAVNAVSPVAGTRLTQPLWPDDVYAKLTPELTSPIIVYLCHPSCKDNGELFELGGGWVGALRLQRTYGVGFPTDFTQFTPELVAEQWRGVVDFSRVTHPTSTQDSFEPMMRNVTAPPKSLTTSRSIECAEVFNRLRATLQEKGQALSKQISGVLEWHINKEVWTISLLNGKGILIEGSDPRLAPDLQIHMDEQDFLDLAAGRLRMQQALIRKKLRLQGNLKMAMKLQPFADFLLQQYSARL